jgi:putative transposase
LARKIFKHLLGKNRKPRFNNISMHLDSKANTYAEKLEGEFLNYCQVVENDGKIEFRIIKQLRKKEYIPAQMR